MPIIDTQRRMAEKGRIRLGVKKTTSNGKSYPAKLQTLRLTSPDRRVIDQAAHLWGGTVEPWEGQWEVITDATELDVAVMVALMEFDSWYENWSGAVCRARCDGAYDTVRNVPCDCDPESRTCKSTTRIQLLLPDLAGLGTWRLETHGYYARQEIAGAVEVIRMAAALGSILPARLRLEPRTVRRLIDNKVETRNFVVPVLDVDVSARDLINIRGGAALPAVTERAGVTTPSLRVAGQDSSPPVLTASGAPDAAPTPPAPSSWKPVDQAALQPAPLVSVADQMAELDRPRKPRKNAATPLPATGIKPRLASEAICHLCGQDYGSDALTKNKASTGGRFVHASCAAKMETPAESDGAVGIGTDAGDRGGTSGDGDKAAVAEPAPVPVPATKGTRSLTHNQHRLLMALQAEAFPVNPAEVSGPEADAYRRTQIIEIARLLGQTITSRSQLDGATGSALIDILKGIRDGVWRWERSEDPHGAGRLIDAETGEFVTLAGEA